MTERAFRITVDPVTGPEITGTREGLKRIRDSIDWVLETGARGDESAGAIITLESNGADGDTTNSRR